MTPYKNVAEQSRLLKAIDRSMAVIEFDLHGMVLRANDNFLQTLGYRQEQVIGQSHRLFCTLQYARSNEYQQLWSRLKDGQFQSGTFERLDSAGQSLWLEASYNPIRDESGAVYKVVKYAVNVTPQVEKHAQDAQSASQAYHISVQTRKVAEQGTGVIQQAASEMRQIVDNIEDASSLIAKLGERSEQITAIVNTIRSIADQTNLLALNAAIEAARAGEQGRGFAVVADEVRQLAARTSGSTAEISSMIDMIQSETQQAIKSMDGSRERAAKGVQLADQTGTVILQIRDGASDAVQAVSMLASERGGI
ncbi:methyl-accepting chemotaxis protein [Pseudomonas sp. LD120]|uniref:methyl-accepting chemotaxis protein n=1 Tax=Pseudomonas sp. LD120 TaxID=485751 RepID=UPI0035327B0E